MPVEIRILNGLRELTWQKEPSPINIQLLKMYRECMDILWAHVLNQNIHGSSLEHRLSFELLQILYKFFLMLIITRSVNCLHSLESLILFDPGVIKALFGSDSLVWVDH